jgi:hypothetical protein
MDNVTTYEMPDTSKRVLRKLTEEDVAGLIKAHVAYGDSWKRRGGVGAFMMLARKFDRIENQCRQQNWDIFKVIELQHNKPDGILDDIRDLRRYLLLVEQEMRLREPVTADKVDVSVVGAATREYIDQDRR